MTAFVGRCPRCRAPARFSAVLIRVERVGVDLLGEPVERHVYAAPWGETRLDAGELRAQCLCGAKASFRQLKGKRTGARCNVQCRMATSDLCECACAGKNHGSAHA